MDVVDEKTKTWAIRGVPGWNTSQRIAIWLNVHELSLQRK